MTTPTNTLVLLNLSGGFLGEKLECLALSELITAKPRSEAITEVYIRTRSGNIYRVGETVLHSSALSLVPASTAENSSILSTETLSSLILHVGKSMKIAGMMTTSTVVEIVAVHGEALSKDELFAGMPFNSIRNEFIRRYGRQLPIKPR